MNSAGLTDKDNVPIYVPPMLTGAERYAVRRHRLRHSLAMAREWNRGGDLMRDQSGREYHDRERDWYVREAADCLREMLLLEIEYST